MEQQIADPAENMKTNLQKNREKDFVQIFKPGQVSHFTWDWPSEVIVLQVSARKQFQT